MRDGDSNLASRTTGLGPIRSHWWPRTRDGRIAIIVFLALLVLAEPPAVYVLANRIAPRIAGVPFLYVYLLVIYATMVAVLLWARRRNL